QRKADDALLLEDRPLAQFTVVGGELMELRPFPRIERMIVALGALNLDAQEDARSLRGAFGGGVGATARQQEERRPVRRLRRTDVLHLAARRQHRPRDLRPALVLLDLLDDPRI